MKAESKKAAPEIIPRLVYIIQDGSGKNFLPAEAFGKIRVVLPVFRDPAQLPALLENGLRDMHADDCLLLVGSPIAIACAAVIAFRKFPTVNFLVWDRQDYKYNLHPVTL